MTALQKTRIFETDEGQAVDIPAEFEFRADEVYVQCDMRTGGLVLSERPFPPTEAGETDGVEQP